MGGDYLISDHGFEELQNDGILAIDVIDGIAAAVSVEEYSDRVRGPSMLTLQRDRDNHPLHIVWAIPRNARRPAVLVTAYRPEPMLWDEDWKVRRTS
jgi:hypothetical protein